MYKDREWAHFRHCETFSKKKIEQIFFPAGPPAGIIIRAWTNYDACG